MNQIHLKVEKPIILKTNLNCYMGKLVRTWEEFTASFVAIFS